MYSKLHRPEKNELGASENAGSCVKLACYLNKEAGVDKAFFSHHNNNVSLTEVIQKIDGNKRTLKNNQDKFYMLSYNPSQKEIVHLIKIVTGKKVTEMSELNNEERQKVLFEFQNYVRECMEIYAKNFNRNKNLNADDLVYFGRVEEYRHYTYLDEAVQLGLKNKGDLKEGLQLHAHIVVSRMDASQTISLSPLAKSMGNTNVLNGKNVNNGFCMKEWQFECFQLFSTKYRYVASEEERFYYGNPSYSKYKNYIKNKITNEILEGMNEERRILSSVKSITMIVHPSKKSINLYLKRKIKDILFDKEPVI